MTVTELPPPVSPPLFAPHRVSIPTELPDAYQAMAQLSAAASRALAAAKLDQRVGDLVRVRTSQLNRCGYCLDLHCRDARRHGERQERLDVVAGWRESPSLFTVEEQLALELGEAITLLSEHGVPDALYQAAAEVLSPKQIAAITMIAVVANAWNRIVMMQHLAPLGDAA